MKFGQFEIRTFVEQHSARQAMFGYSESNVGGWSRPKNNSST
jgi:hypothetical protein